MVENFIQSGNARIWTCAQGMGMPLLLCNGGPGCCDYLGPVASMVDDVAFVIRWEQRGCGRSDPIGPFDVTTCINDIEAIREYYGIHSWIVGGHSWGPALAMAYAVTHPSYVEGLLALSGGAIHKDSAWGEQYNQQKDSEIVPEFQFPPNLAVNKDVNASWARFVRRPRLLREIAELDVPAVFFWGQNDIRPSWPVQQTAHLMRRGTFVCIDDAPHALWLSHASELKALLRGFVLDVERVRGDGV